MRIATLFLLPQCDLSCRFCGSELGFDCLAETDALEAVEFFAARDYGSVVLGGGEPLLWHGDLLRIAAHAQELGLTVQLNTNGVAWREELEHATAIQRIILPLDGATHHSHDALRAPHGGHRAVVEDRLERLRIAQKEVTLGSVVCRHNVEELPQLAAELTRWAHSGLQIHAWHLYRFRPIGRGGKVAGRYAELGLSQQEFRAHCLPIQKLRRSWRSYRRPDMTRSQDVDFFWREGGSWCATGRGPATTRNALKALPGAQSALRHPAPAPFLPLKIE